MLSRCDCAGYASIILLVKIDYMNSTDKSDDRASRERQAVDEAGNNNPSEFVVGLVTFIVFIVFMTAWMYFGLTGVIDY